MLNLLGLPASFPCERAEAAPLRFALLLLPLAFFSAPALADAGTHWAFRPIADPASASPSDRGDWALTAIDRFVLARLESAGLAPSPPADRRTLIRRVTFDLTGLPASPDEVDAFLSDESPDDDAFAKVVDRLLASPRYGERWGRHWLDVARYADTKGYVFTEERRYPYAYTYRDYVVRSFNEDLPYDRFVVEQIAADRLDLGADPRPLAALGFLTLGRRFLNNQQDIIDDRIDVATRGLMALTVQCARCHDHKYDPIPSEDYYSLYGVFASSLEPRELPEIGPPEDREAHAAFRQELAKRRTETDAFFRQEYDRLLAELRADAGEYLAALALGETEPPAEFAVAAGKREVRPQVLQRWREYLASRAGTADRVFAPWHAVFSVKAAELDAKVRELLASWAADPEAAQRVNSRVREAFIAQAPKSRLDVARVYGEVLAQAAKAGPGEEIESLGNDDAEIRAVLFAEDSPAHVSPEAAPQLIDRAARDQLRKLEREVARLEVEHAGAPARAMVLVDAPSPQEPRVFLRGKASSPGPHVPRRFLAVLSGAARVPFGDGSGRLELAHAIASAQNPLTARVLANRVWMHLFGSGLVRTPGDFGLRSDPPSHPELLDWLASRLVEDGWSIKTLLRRIVLSAAYRQSSALDFERMRRDPDNLLLWRMSPRRLEFEALRDALLWASGALDLRIGGKPVDLFAGGGSDRRTLYGFIDRQNLPPTLRAFDFASPDATCPERHETTVPQQALWLMNGPFAAEQAKRVVARADFTAIDDPRQRVAWLFHLLYARPPEDGEVAAALEYIGRDAGGDAWARLVHALFLANEFVFVD